MVRKQTALVGSIRLRVIISMIKHQTVALKTLLE